MVMKFRVPTIALFALTVSAFTAPAWSAEDPVGGCLISPAAVPATDIQDFLKDPQALLKQFPLGGPDMIRKVRGLAATEAKTVPPLMDDAKAGTDAHKVAIANGLAGAALACVKTRADVSLFIQQKVAGFDSKPFLDAFLLSTSNVATAATGGGGGGGGAGIGGAVGAALGGNGGAAGGQTNNGNFTTANTSGTFSFGSGASVSSITNRTTAVSP